jgi:hypothetical protein
MNSPKIGWTPANRFGVKVKVSLSRRRPRRHLRERRADRCGREG